MEEKDIEFFSLLLYSIHLQNYYLFLLYNDHLLLVQVSTNEKNVHENVPIEQSALVIPEKMLALDVSAYQHKCCFHFNR